MTNNKMNRQICKNVEEKVEKVEKEVEEMFRQVCEGKGEKGGKVELLQTLPRIYQMYLLHLAVIAVKRGTRKVDFARRILTQLNRRDDGQKIIESPAPYDQALFSFRKVTVATTGARQGDVLTGTHLGTRDAVMKVHTTIPPARSRLDRIRAYPELWRSFLRKLAMIPFFREMSILERELYLDLTEENDDFFNGNTRLQLLQPGTGDVNTKKGSIFSSYLPSSEINRLLSNNEDSEDGFFSPSEINDTVIEYTGKSSTLAVLKSFWRLSTTSISSFSDIKNYTGFIIDINTGEVLSRINREEKEEEKSPGQEEKIIIIPDITASVQEVKGRWVRGDDRREIACVVDGKESYDTPNNIVSIEKKYTISLKTFSSYTTGFTAAGYKSLLQKIIRFQPLYVRVNKTITLPGKDALICTFLLLLQHPGSFVPNIQRYVSGMESALKRLAVSIYEDSSWEDGGRMLSLLTAALLAQRVKEWKPSYEMVIGWIEMAVEAYENPVSFHTDYMLHANSKPFVISEEIRGYVWKVCSSILDELKSFPTDLGLARGWAIDLEKGELKSGRRISDGGSGIGSSDGGSGIGSSDGGGGVGRPEEMPIYHAIDHHCCPSFVYYYNYPDIESRVDITSKPFANLFSSVFWEVTGVNPRKIKPNNNTNWSTDFENRSFVKATRKAQRTYYNLLRGKREGGRGGRDLPDETFHLTYTLEDGWLSGLAGVMNIGKMIVTLNADDPLHLVVARQPLARRGKTEYRFPSVQEEESTISIAKTRLRRGISLSACNAPIEGLENARLMMMNDEREGDEGEEKYVIKRGREVVDWEEMKVVRMSYLAKRGWEERLMRVVDETEKVVLDRLFTYISTAKLTIEMNRISRDGGGGVSAYDVMVNKFLRKVCAIIPAAIVAVPGKPSIYSVQSPPLFWYIRDKIRERIRERIEDDVENDVEEKEVEVKNNYWGGGRFADETREPYEYQTSLVEEMMKKRERGRTGHFLFLRLGSGKTKIVLDYLKLLKERKELVKYVLYTLPPESIISIIREIQVFDIPIHVIIPLKNIRKKRQPFDEIGISVSNTIALRPYHINLVIHDHLRNCVDGVQGYLSETLVIFDEVHLFLNQTIRTSVGMTISRLSKEFICLTGTPLVDNKTEKLIGWLEQIVPFEVNKSNFWVAANSMLTKKISTDVISHSNQIECKFTSSEEKRYAHLVSPTLGGSNTNMIMRELIEGMEICYRATDRAMIEKVVDIVRRGDDGVMVVARNANHASSLHIELSKTIGGENIFVIGKDKSIFLTDESIQNGTPDYKVVITTKNRSQGYTLTRLNHMVTGVYPSNMATRDQLRGRINRIGQKKEVFYYTFHIGVLSNILTNHDSAASMTKALQSLAKDVGRDV